MIKVKLVHSKICCNPNQRRTLQALGLRRIHQVRELEDVPSVWGMINKVIHLVEVIKD